MGNAGIVSCPNGLCVVRSERQKLYFLLARSDKVHECKNIANDVFNLKNVEQPFPGELDRSVSAMQDHKEHALQAAASLRELATVHEEENSVLLHDALKSVDST